MQPLWPVDAMAATARRWPGRACVAAMVCVALPAASWVGAGRGRLAYTMYSSTVAYRLELSWTDREGRRSPLAPTDVAGEVSFDSAAPFLAGAERFRVVPQIDALRAHLGDVARAACRTRPASSVEVVLRETAGPHDAELTAVHTRSVSCPNAR